MGWAVGDVGPEAGGEHGSRLCQGKSAHAAQTPSGDATRAGVPRAGFLQTPTK